MLVKVLSAAMLLSGLWGPLELTAGAESPRPPAATSTSPAGNPQATQPVAAWDVVPFQVFDKPFHVGVVAFHETGCKVEFSVRAAGTETATRPLVVENPTLNVQSNVWEFWYPLDPSTLPDGPVEVRAKVIPRGAGMTIRELAPLTLYANGHRSLKFGEPVWVDGTTGDDAADGTKARPLKTLAAAVKKAPDGGTIYLSAGKGYSAHALGGGLKRTYWTVIAAAPGTKRDAVEIGPGRPGTDKLCFRGVTLYSDPPSRAYNTILAGEQGKAVVWVDDCKLCNKKGRWGGGGVAFGNRYVPYVTGGLTTEMNDGPGGVLMRGHQIVKITSDAFTGVQTAIHCSVEDIDPGQTGAHPDFHQSYVGDPNAFNTVILYNVWGKRCISQGFFGHNLRDSAFVNCLFHKGDTVMVSQYSGPLEHVLFLHLSLPNQSWLWRDGFQPTNCYMIDCLLTSLSTSPKAQAEGVTCEALHVTGAKSPSGQGGSVGAVEFVDIGKLDFRPVPDSAAAAGGVPLRCVTADLTGRLYDSKSPSRGCFQAVPDTAAQNVNERHRTGTAIGIGLAATEANAPSENKASSPPAITQVGPRVRLTPRAGGVLAPGNYSGVRFTETADLQNSGNYLFTDCVVQFGTVSGAPSRTVLLDHCKTDAIWFAEGGQKGWTIRFTHVLGGPMGLRPSTGRNGWDSTTPTPFVVEDTIVEISSRGSPAQHVEAMQALGGNGMRFSRVRFIVPGPKQDGITGQTASVNIIAGDSLFEDCEFLNAGAYYYTVYSDGPNNVFRRCRFGRGAANYFYPTDAKRTAPVAEKCSDLATGGPVVP